MTSNLHNQDMRKREGIFKAQNTRAILVAIADDEAHQFILSVVEETWVKKLEKPDNYYNKVTTRQLLDHLYDNCAGLKKIDDVDICLTMPTGWDGTPSMSRYILRM